MSLINWEPYVTIFNQNDEEIIQQKFPNKDALEWMRQEVPLFECPDKAIEETYYFRWWVFRKHIEETPEGRIITEFLPKVEWAGPYNSINCAAGHHLAEARWLRHDKSLAEEYIRFWFKGSGDVTSYSSWIVDAVYRLVLTTGNKAFAVALLDNFIQYYESYEKSNFTPYGLFWSSDDRDAMEMSISGSGLRPTLNSYMAANANAIAQIAQWAGRSREAELYQNKAKLLRENIRRLLWDADGQFFKVIPMKSRDTALGSLSFKDVETKRNVRESIGYIP